MRRAAKVAISIPSEDLERLEALRREMDLGRSEIIATAIRFWLKWMERQELIRRYSAGYRKNPEKAAEIKSLEAASLEALDPDEVWR